MDSKVVASARERKNIAIIAHDGKEKDLLEWAESNKDFLGRHQVYSVGTTGTSLEQKLRLSVKTFQNGPIGGDVQIGMMAALGNIDLLIFFWDPMEQLPCDTDVMGLLRIALLWNVSVACNRASADSMISSHSMFSQQELLFPHDEKDDIRLPYIGQTTFTQEPGLSRV
jgi:methylglyoxal synthase